jgi:hypothetical protein
MCKSGGFISLEVPCENERGWFHVSKEADLCLGFDMATDSELAFRQERL